MGYNAYSGTHLEELLLTRWPHTLKRRAGGTAGHDGHSSHESGSKESGFD